MRGNICPDYYFLILSGGLEEETPAFSLIYQIYLEINSRSGSLPASAI
jgi:hypothetical protein